MTHLHHQVLAEGTQIGVYEIKSVAKITAFEITYRAWNHHLKEQVKIREYFPYDFARRGSDLRSVEPKSEADKENYDYGLRAFLNQAEVLTQLEHPHIVPLENILPFNGTAYMILSIREGMPLSRLVQSQASFAETELKFILTSILSAVQKLHEHRIVHGGIQPATILIGKEGLPLLVNIAGARLAIAARTPHYADELATGYAPAEQYEPANVVGPATDFYALGATMYACMTHRQPVAAQSRKSALSLGESDPMALPSEAAETSSNPELREAIQWMLRPDYTDRPQSAAEILALLKTEQVYDPSTTESPRYASDGADGRRVGKQALVAGITLGVVALAGIGIWFNQSTVETSPAQSNAIDNPVSLQSTLNETIAAPESGADSAITQPPERSEAQVAVSEPTDAQFAQTAIDHAQHVSVVEQPRSQAMRSSDQSLDLAAINKHLTSAERAFKAGRLTTPAKDNANKYYQMVLAIDPDNPRARAGQQQIVDQYVRFIETAKARGQRHHIQRYLQRAESVLPDDPKLERIRSNDLRRGE